MAIPTGAVRYNTDSNKMEVYIGSTWMEVAVSSPNLDGGSRGIMAGGYPQVDNIDYFKKYHVSANKFVEYLNKNNWVIQTFGKDSGPAKNYMNPEYKGKFGVIAPYSKDFCKSCNRLRITAKGDLRLCLFGNTGINIRHLMQKDNQIDELKDLILKQLNYKKETHHLELGETGLTKNLSKTGG